MSNYDKAGVRVSAADEGIRRMLPHLARTWPAKNDTGAVHGFGSFATLLVLDDDNYLAWSTDGVGSKTMIADMMNTYETIGIDCVAMNVNDLICVGARPISMLDYLAVDAADPDMIEDIGIGLAKGAIEAGISISGGEISQLPDSLSGFDLVGAAYGVVKRKNAILGDDIQFGDAIIGIASSGIHANGMSLARRVLFKECALDPSFYEYDGIEDGLGSELLKPTEIYVKTVLDLMDDLPVHGLANITGDGLLNLNRLNCDGLGFFLDTLPEPPSIFKLIQEYGRLDDATMHQTFNMGIGFCVVVDAKYANDAIGICAKHGKVAWQIGTIVADKYKTVHLDRLALVGRGKIFERL